jgi:pimeloyl-ACP methyl ester carboxylesterase
MPVQRVIMLPGSVLPASLAYPALLDQFGPEVEAVAKELEVYVESTPPANYSLDSEVAGIDRVAAERGWDTFHLVGYSGGGASVLAFTARRPARVLSLSLLEPAWAGNWDDMSDAHRALWRRYEELQSLPPDQFMAGFMRLGVRPEVTLAPPPAGPPPPWMAKRPAGIRAFLATFATYDLDRQALRDYTRPVYFALGGLSNPDEYGEIAERLARTFPDFTLEVFPERHHFDPPHRIQPADVAKSLQEVWGRAQPT